MYCSPLASSMVPCPSLCSNEIVKIVWAQKRVREAEKGQRRTERTPFAFVEISVVLAAIRPDHPTLHQKE